MDVVILLAGKFFLVEREDIATKRMSPYQKKRCNYSLHIADIEHSIADGRD